MAELGTHAVRDVPRPERVVQLCHPDIRNEFPPLRTAKSARSHNLPAQLTSFVGRAGPDRRGPRATSRQPSRHPRRAPAVRARPASPIEIAAALVRGVRRTACGGSTWRHSPILSSFPVTVARTLGAARPRCRRGGRRCIRVATLPGMARVRIGMAMRGRRGMTHPFRDARRQRRRHMPPASACSSCSHSSVRANRSPTRANYRHRGRKRKKHNDVSMAMGGFHEDTMHIVISAHSVGCWRRCRAEGRLRIGDRTSASPNAPPTQEP